MYIPNHLLQLGLLVLAKRICINALHLKDRWLLLLQELLIKNGIIEIIMEGVPETILKAEIFLIFCI